MDVIASLSGLGSVAVAVAALVYAIRAAQQEHQAAQDTVRDQNERLAVERRRQERLALLLELSREVGKTLAFDAREEGVAALRRSEMLLRTLPNDELPVTRVWVAKDRFPEALKELIRRQNATGVHWTDQVETDKVGAEIADAITAAAPAAT